MQQSTPSAKQRCAGAAGGPGLALLARHRPPYLTAQLCKPSPSCLGGGDVRAGSSCAQLHQYRRQRARHYAAGAARAGATDVATLVEAQDPSHTLDVDGPTTSSSSSSTPSVPEVSLLSIVDGMYTVRGRVRIAASADEVYGLLTNYACCHHVFSNIHGTDIVTTEAGGLQLIQACKWNFLAFTGTFQVHLAVSEDARQRTLLFSLVRSAFMNDFRGLWKVRPAPPGPAAGPAQGHGQQGQQQQYCDVEHELSVVPSVPVPGPISFYTGKIFVRQVDGILADLLRWPPAGSPTSGLQLVLRATPY